MNIVTTGSVQYVGGNQKWIAITLLPYSRVTLKGSIEGKAFQWAEVQVVPLHGERNRPR